MAVREFLIWHGILEQDSAGGEDWKMLDRRERNRAAKFVDDGMRGRYVRIRAGLRRVLADRVGGRPETLRIQTRAFGKPYLVDHPELEFNLSHSGRHVLLGVGYGCRLGVDIEIGKNRVDLAGLARRCFSEEERDFWLKLPDMQKSAGFYQTWTLKEAFVKAVGRGLGLGLSDCVPNPGRLGPFLRVPSGCGSASDWHGLPIILAPDCHAALVADKKADSVALYPFPQ